MGIKERRKELKEIATRLFGYSDTDTYNFTNSDESEYRLKFKNVAWRVDKLHESQNPLLVKWVRIAGYLIVKTDPKEFTNLMNKYLM